ncbi:UNVERIFIED_CONTAM: hypothetical protein RKD50_003328 [Streptomyces canus]
MTASAFSDNESVAPRGQNVTPEGRSHVVPVVVGFDADSDTLPSIEAGAGQLRQLLRDAPRDELLTAARAAADGRTVGAGPRSTAHDRTDSPVCDVLTRA